MMPFGQFEESRRSYHNVWACPHSSRLRSKLITLSGSEAHNFCRALYPQSPPQKGGALLARNREKEHSNECSLLFCSVRIKCVVVSNGGVRALFHKHVLAARIEDVAVEFHLEGAILFAFHSAENDATVFPFGRYGEVSASL